AAGGGAAQVLAEGVEPIALALTPGGQVLIGDAGQGRVVSAAPDGQLTNLTAAGAVKEPAAIAVHGTDVYVADGAMHQIWRLAAEAGAPTLVAGSRPGFQDGIGDQARFYRPT